MHDEEGSKAVFSKTVFSQSHNANPSPGGRSDWPAPRPALLLAPALKAASAAAGRGSAGADA